MMTIILLGILGAIISAIIGTCWYSMKTPMGRIHLASLGFTKLSAEEQKKKMEEMKPHLWKSYLMQMFLSFLTAVFIAFIMIQQKMAGVGAVAIYWEISFIWLCFTIPMVGQALLWSNVDPALRWKKFFSEIFANLVIYVVIVFVFSLIL